MLGRSFLLATMLVCSVARADDAVLPAESITVAFSGAAGHLHGVQAGVFGVEGELALTRGRWQVFGAAAVGYLQFWPTSDGTYGIGGRLGVGARWMPRTAGDSEGGFDIVTETGIGIDGYAWDGQRLARPDVYVGIGYQVRARINPHTTLRLRSMARLILAYDDEQANVACRGCTGTPTHLDGGLGMVMGFVW